MSTARFIDRICMAAAAIAVILAFLLMALADPKIAAQAGSAGLAGTDVWPGTDADGPFTEDDRNGVWSTAAATQITLAGGEAAVKGNGAYFYDGDVHIVYGGHYVISGALDDGGIVVEAGGNDGIWILLDGATIRHNDGAALCVEQAGKVFLTLAEGTENRMTGGEAYSEAAVSAGIDGVIYSRDDLTINGSGSLYVEAGTGHGIVGNDDLILAGGTIRVSAPEDGIHANDSVRIADAGIMVEAGDDGITVSNDDEDGYFYMESGILQIPSCYEGIEGNEVVIAGGTVDITPADDGINAAGGENPVIRIAGGDIRIVNETGRDADGLDSNGDIILEGGSVFVSMSGSGGNCALDCGSETGGQVLIHGGQVVAAGGSMMMEAPSSESEQKFVLYNGQAEAGTEVELRGEDGEVLLAETIPCGFTNLIVSVPGLQVGDVCTLSLNGAEEQLTVSDSYEMAGRGIGGRGMGGWGMNGQRMGGREMDSREIGDLGTDGQRMGDQGTDEQGMGDLGTNGREMRGRWGMGAPGDAEEAGAPASGRFQPGEAAASSNVPPEAPVLLAVSVLVLLAGIGIAFKYR